MLLVQLDPFVKGQFDDLTYDKQPGETETLRSSLQTESDSDLQASWKRELEEVAYAERNPFLNPAVLRKKNDLDCIEATRGYD